jgi:hypothetical protein
MYWGLISSPIRMDSRGCPENYRRYAVATGPPVLSVRRLIHASIQAGARARAGYG